MSIYGISNEAGAISYANQEFTPDFSDLSLTISSNIQKLVTYVSQLERLVGQLGTAGDCKDLRRKISQTQSDANSTAKKTKDDLAALKMLPKPVTQTEEVRRRVQQDRLVNEFTRTLNQFQSLQRAAVSKQKEGLEKARFSRISQVSDEQDMTEINLSNSPKHGSVMMVAADNDLAMVQEREEALKQLEADITDVNGIFKDLGLLVHDQGEIIDSIEASVEAASTNVEAGTEQLRQARDYKAKCRKKCCILFIALIVVLAIIGMIIALVLGNN